MMKVKGSHRHIEVAPRRRLYWRRSMIKWNFQLWLALNGAQHINTLFCKPINQSKPRWRRVKRLLEAQHEN